MWMASWSSGAPSTDESNFGLCLVAERRYFWRVNSEKIQNLQNNKKYIWLLKFDIFFYNEKFWDSINLFNTNDSINLIDIFQWFFLGLREFDRFMAN